MVRKGRGSGLGDRYLSRKDLIETGIVGMAVAVGFGGKRGMGSPIDRDRSVDLASVVYLAFVPVPSCSDCSRTSEQRREIGVMSRLSFVVLMDRGCMLMPQRLSNGVRAGRHSGFD